VWIQYEKRVNRSQEKRREGATCRDRGLSNPKRSKQRGLLIRKGKGALRGKPLGNEGAHALKTTWDVSKMKTGRGTRAYRKTMRKN